MVQFANRMDLLHGSEIRELLKLTAQPDIISFAGGLPAAELFPVEEMMAASKAVLEEHGREALQYSTTEGFPRLREQIAERMLAKNNIHTDPDHILVTSGSQQGLDFSARVFLNPGDVVLLESPSYLGAVNAFKACEPRFIEVPTDDGGMMMDELEKILAMTERVKMIYVIPDFQNPTGRTWDLDRRHRFMEIINKYEIPVVEDNPYGELRFEGEYMPALKSLDTKGLVIYLGTFSKILAPGYRLGWVCADDAILSKFNFMEQAASLQASTIGQMDDELYHQGYKLAVVTNKPKINAVTIVNHLFPGKFMYVFGNTVYQPKKPHPCLVQLAMQLMESNKNETLMIGDSNVDIETAINAKIKSVGCEWGFRGKEELVQAGATYTVSKPSDIKDILK